MYKQMLQNMVHVFDSIYKKTIRKNRVRNESLLRSMCLVQSMKFLRNHDRVVVNAAKYDS
jgi:hypothetical protein